MSDNKQVNNSDGKNSPIGYADLLPTELWSSIFLYTEEIDSARLNRACKKFKNIMISLEQDCKAQCKSLELGRPFGPLKLSFNWEDIYNCDRAPMDYSSHAQFSWKTLYKSWLNYISEIRSTPKQPSSYYVQLMTSEANRFSELRCTDDYKFLYAGVKGDYNNGTELAICELENGEYYFGLSNRSNYDVWELYSSFEKEFTEQDLTKLLARGFKDVSYAFPEMCTKELLTIPGIDISLIKYVFMNDFERRAQRQSYTRKQKALVAIKHKRIKCSEVGCKQYASHSCAKVKCNTHCSCMNHKHAKKK